MSEVKRENTVELENSNPQIKLSKSFYQSLYDIASKSPAAAISSICALFITVILAIVIPVLFAPCKNSS